MKLNLNNKNILFNKPFVIGAAITAVAAYGITTLFLSCCGALTFTPTEQYQYRITQKIISHGQILSFDEERRSILFRGQDPFIPSEKIRMRFIVPENIIPEKESGVPVSLSEISYPTSATVIYTLSDPEKGGRISSPPWESIFRIREITLNSQ